MKGFASLRGMSRIDIDSLLDDADRFSDLLGSGAGVAELLSGRTVVNAFFEASTRTRMSFERAAGALGATTLDLHPEISSTVKGESLRDTLLTVAALGTDLLVLRHVEDDAATLAAEWTGLPVVNAGSGRSGHPTQTLLDLMTIRRRCGAIDGVRVGVVGDIVNSRVASGLIDTLPVMGATVSLFGPDRFLPVESRSSRSLDLDRSLPELDVVYLLRVQTERGAVAPDDFIKNFSLNPTRSARLPERAVVMRPGPMNRGVEIDGEVADGPRSLILDQVRNGVPARMAVLARIAESLQ